MDKIEEASFGPLEIAKFWMHAKIISSKTPFAIRHGQCWEWQGPCFKSGYGHFTSHRKSYRAHRVSWYLTNSNIPSDKCVCHKCDNPKCVNPNHLFLGSPKENTTDMIRKGRLKKDRGQKTKSKYIGVSYRKDSKKFRARYMVDYKNILIGQFETELEAAQAYDAKMREIGDLSRLNFPM